MKLDEFNKKIRNYAVKFFIRLSELWPTLNQLPVSCGQGTDGKSLAFPFYIVDEQSPDIEAWLIEMRRNEKYNFAQQIFRGQNFLQVHIEVYWTLLNIYDIHTEFIHITTNKTTKTTKNVFHSIQKNFIHLSKSHSHFSEDKVTHKKDTTATKQM